MASKPKKAEAAADRADGEAAAAPKRKFSRKLTIMVALGLAVVGGGGAGAYVFMFAGKAHEKLVVVVKPPAFFDMPDVLVNLTNTGGNDRTQYLRAKIVLEVADQATIEQIKPVLPRVLDTFQTYLREMRKSDLEGSAGLYRLRDELTRRVNVAIAPSKVNAVLFKEIVVQ